MATPCDSVDILMVGKTGNGKSATGNMILQKDAFATSSDTTSFTVNSKIDFSAFENCILTVVDSPGLNDTMRSVEDSIKQFVKAMKYAIAANPEGYHCILIVQRFGGRFTREDVKVVGILKEVFGDQFIKYHAIVVLTCGDNFEAEMAKSGKSFETWCSEQEGEFKNLLSECGNRIVLFDNMTNDKIKASNQIRTLIHKVKELSKDGKRYSNEIFEQAKNTRDTLMVKAQVPRLSDEVLREIALIIRELGLIDFGQPETEVPRLYKIMERVDRLRTRIVTEDKGTNALKGVLSLVDNFSKPFTEHLDVMRGAQDLKQRKEKLEEDLKKCQLSKSDQKAYLNKFNMSQKVEKQESTAERQYSHTRGGSNSGSGSETSCEAGSSQSVAEEGSENTQLKELPRSLSVTELELMNELKKTKDELFKLRSEQDEKVHQNQKDLEKQYKDIRDDPEKNSFWQKIVDTIQLSIDRFRIWWTDD